MQGMAKRVPDAVSYAPVTVLVDERSDGVHISYDRMASLLAPYENSEVLAVARNLNTFRLASRRPPQIFPHRSIFLAEVSRRRSRVATLEIRKVRNGTQ